MMKLHLLTKLLLYVLLPSLLGMCVIAGIGYRGAESALNSQITEELTQVLERQKSELDNITDLLVNVIRNSAMDGDTIDLLNALAATPGTTDPQTQQLLTHVQEFLQTTAQTFPRLQDIGLIDAQGKTLAHTDKARLNTDQSSMIYFKEAMQGRGSRHNLKSDDSKILNVIIAEPIRKNGKFLGVMYAAVDIANLSKTTTDTVKIGRTSACFVYDSTGKMLMHPNKAYLGEDFSKNDWSRKIIEQKTGRVEYILNDKLRVAYFREIPNMEWIVILAVDSDDMLKPIAVLLRNTIIAVLAIGILVGLIIFFVAKNLSWALKGCATVVGQVAEGNLETSDTQNRGLAKVGSRSDELGLVARGITVMVGNIRKLFKEGDLKTKEAEAATTEAREAMAQADEARKAAENAKREGMLAAARQLEDVVNILSSASTELSAQIEQSERGATQQAARASETATAMEEMNSTVIEVARNAGEASTVSAQTREKAEHGAAIVKKAVESIRLVQQESLALKDDMVTLGEHARSISQIMGVISDIADQTNLLALNAAIEAARAGEAGRGFAVVADEVRKLAEKTMASTTDVGNAIRSIQQSADKSMTQVDQAVKTIQEATTFANDSGTALEEIVTMADNTADQVRAIATASEQQSATSEEINRSVTLVNSIAEETSRTMQEAASSVSDLAAQAQALSGLIDDMKRG